MAHDISVVLGRLAAALCSALAVVLMTAAVAKAASTIQRLCPPARAGHVTCVAERLVTSSDQQRLFTPTDQV